MKYDYAVKYEGKFYMPGEEIPIKDTSNRATKSKTTKKAVCKNDAGTDVDKG